VLEVEVEGRGGLTTYAFWVSRLRLWPLWALMSAVIAVALWMRYRPHRE
jgi:apolipoprotein N-acyltransferase